MNIRVRDNAEKDAAKGEGFVAGYLLFLLAAASDAASKEFHAQVRARGLRVPEWRILACLGDEDGQMVTQLAQLALMEQSHLTKIIDQMSRNGLVTRRSDAKDRRRVRVYLTEAGRALGNEIVAAARIHENSIIERLRPGEAAMLKEGLKRINALYRSGAEARPLETPA